MELQECLEIMNKSIEEAVNENRDYVEMDITDAIDIGCELGKVLRNGEISNLLISDIDFYERSVNVREGKTVNAERTVFMSIKAKNAILKYLCGRTNGYVFTASKGRHAGKKPTNRTIENIAIDIGKRANCHVKTTVHLYRKTFASITFEKANDMQLVSKLLGHSSTNTTEKCYVVESKENFKYKAKRVAS